MLATIRTNSSPRAAAFSVLAILLALPAASDVARAQEGVIGWGSRVVDSRWNQQSFVQVAAGAHHTVALRSDGNVVAWGNNNSGQCNVPALPPGLSYVEVAAAGNNSLAVGHSV